MVCMDAFLLGIGLYHSWAFAREQVFGFMCG